MGKEGRDRGYEPVVLFPMGTDVYHKPNLATLGSPLPGDPAWFRAEDYASPQCRRGNKGKLTSRQLAEEYGNRACRLCYPREDLSGRPGQ